MKNLHKFYNRADIPWINIIWANHYSHSLPSDKPVGSFWWRDVLKTLESFKALFVSAGLVGRNDSWPDCFSNLYKL
jgi:hypothetical protein